jgi:hypothetical protein
MSCQTDIYKQLTTIRHSVPTFETWEVYLAYKSSKMAHLVLSCNKEDYLSLMPNKWAQTGNTMLPLSLMYSFSGTTFLNHLALLLNRFLFKITIPLTGRHDEIELKV